MDSVWVGPFAAATLLLAVAGAAKAWDPTMTVGALRRMGLGVPPAVVRAGGAAEVVLAIVALLTGARAAALAVAASYAVFTVFVGVALARRVPIGSCGCFGRVDTPPSWLHLVVNGLAVASAVGVAVAGGGGLLDVLRDQPLAGVPFAMLVVVATYLQLAALTTLPQLLVLTRERAR